jgi:hypothetical protein
MFYNVVRRDLRNSMSYCLAQTDLKWRQYGILKFGQILFSATVPHLSTKYRGADFLVKIEDAIWKV